VAVRTSCVSRIQHADARMGSVAWDSVGQEGSGFHCCQGEVDDRRDRKLNTVRRELTGSMFAFAGLRHSQVVSEVTAVGAMVHIRQNNAENCLWSDWLRLSCAQHLHR